MKDPKPWEKLQIGVIGAPLKLGQVRKNMLIKQTINQSINLIHKRLQNKATITLLLGLKCRKYSLDKNQCSQNIPTGVLA